MTQSITNIIIAAAAVIGLVPLGVRAIRDLIRTRKRKKANDAAGTIMVSVFLSLIAPGVLEAAVRHAGAAMEALPEWVRAPVAAKVAESAPAESDPPQAAPSANGLAPQYPSVPSK
jgi:hypothetical protein